MRVGARFPIETTATGAVLSAGTDARRTSTPRDDEAAQLAEGYLTRADRLQAGITDVVAAVTDRTGATVAAVTVPYIGTSYSAVGLEAVAAAARAAADEITLLLGGEARATAG